MDLKFQVFGAQNESIFNITESTGINCIKSLNVLNTIDSQSTTEGGAITISGGLGVSKMTRLNYVNSNIQTISNLLVTGDLNVIGQTYVGNITTSNQIETNVTSTSLYINNSLNSRFYNTIGNLYTTTTGIGIFSTNPQHALEIFSSGSIALGENSSSFQTISYNSIGNLLNVNDILFIKDTSVHIGSTNLNTGILNVDGILNCDKLITNNITSGDINFTGDLYKNGSIYISSQWETNNNDIFYTKGNVGINTTTPTSRLVVNGENSVNNTTGALLVTGGIGVTQDVRIGGNLYVNNQIITNNTSGNITIFNQTIGSHTGTGRLDTNVNVTMPDSNYKIIGNLQTTSTVKNIYSLTFNSITNSQFTASMYRIDALGSGWTDPNLTLVYTLQ